MAVQILAPAFKFPELVSAGHLGDDLQFIHGGHPGGSGSGLRVGLSALGALAVHDNARAVSVRAEHAGFEVQSIFCIGPSSCLCFEQCSAGHAIAALSRNLGSTLRAHLARDLLMTVRTFHIQSSRLAFLGSLDLEGHDFLFHLGALALGAPELHLVIF
jgi:hypothetical protein